MTGSAPGTEKRGIEKRGVDTLPEADRTGRPRDVLGILVGSNMCLGVVVFGWLPASFGLGFWAAVSSMVVGTLLGVLLVAPLSVISLRTATNLSTSSGGHFGVRGRLIGSVIGLLLALGYAALTLWTGGAAIVGPLHRILGAPGGNSAYAVTYAVVAALTVLVAVFGYHLLNRMSRWIAIGTAVVLVLGIVAYANQFQTAPVVQDYALGSFWPTWFLSAVAAGLSGPMAFITLLGDYTRYVSPRKHSPRRVLVSAGVGMVLVLLLPQLFGTFTAYAARAADDYVGPLVAAGPSWFLVLLLLNAVFGTVGNAGILLYSMGLDLDAIVPPMTRVQATGLIAVLATALVFLGHFAWDAQGAVTAFVLLLTAVGTPWAVITLLGFARFRGRYDADALQVYNRRSRGGIYWYTGGWNLRATAAWAAGSLTGLLSVDTSLCTGPLVRFTGGVDVSFLLAAAVSAGAFLALEARRVPEHADHAAEPASTSA